MSLPAQLFRLEPVDSPWGDYGNILAQGLSSHLDRHQGLLQLERTGPTIAPITFPGAGDIVVTGALKSALEKSGLSGFTFLPVIKRRIVELDWESWDTTADEPQEFPESGEPEHYILRRPHETRVADELGILWELCLEPGIDADRSGTKITRVRPATWNGADFFRVRTTRWNCVSARARHWLEQHVGDYVELRELVA
jgi:hypothetical protein